MSQNEELFTTRMRKATRKIHNVSDALVNAKFAICKYKCLIVYLRFTFIYTEYCELENLTQYNKRFFKYII